MATPLAFACAFLGGGSPRGSGAWASRASFADASKVRLDSPLRRRVFARVDRPAIDHSVTEVARRVRSASRLGGLMPAQPTQGLSTWRGSMSVSAATTRSSGSARCRALATLRPALARCSSLAANGGSACRATGRASRRIFDIRLLPRRGVGQMRLGRLARHRHRRIDIRRRRVRAPTKNPRSAFLVGLDDALFCSRSSRSPLALSGKG